MTPLSQVLALVESWKALDSDRTALLAKISAGGDASVDATLHFADGDMNTKVLLSSIAADIENQRGQIANALQSLGIDIHS